MPAATRPWTRNPLSAPLPPLSSWTYASPTMSTIPPSLTPPSLLSRHMFFYVPSSLKWATSVYGFMITPCPAIFLLIPTPLWIGSFSATFLSGVLLARHFCYPPSVKGMALVVTSFCGSCYPLNGFLPEFLPPSWYFRDRHQLLCDTLSSWLLLPLCHDTLNSVSNALAWLIHPSSSFLPRELWFSYEDVSAVLRDRVTTSFWTPLVASLPWSD